MAAVLTHRATAEPVDAHPCLAGAEALLRLQKGVVVEPVGLAPPTLEEKKLCQIVTNTLNITRFPVLCSLFENLCIFSNI